MIDSITSSHIWLPKIVEAGKLGSSSEPWRNTVRTGANSPSFVGMSTPPALISIRKAMRIAPIADAGGMFVNPGAWSSDARSRT